MTSLDAPLRRLERWLAERALVLCVAGGVTFWATLAWMLLNRITTQ